VRILYDDERLIIGAELRDERPEGIVGREMKEDATLSNDDAFAVYLDTFHDRRNGYVFETNPLGARSDALIFDEGRNNSPDWDGVWEVATRVTERGWSLEMEIPFKTLHFNPVQTNPWGIQFRRIIRRNAEDAFWSPIPRNEDEWRLSRAGELMGLQEIRQGVNLALKPHLLGSVAERPLLGRGSADGTGDVGLDLRYDLTPNLAAILTVNTDFAETEVDTQQVNITRFPLFFPEKREFFLESKGYFDFGYKKPGPGTPLGAIPFFSRRIGLSASGDSKIPVLGGAKLAGRLGRYNLGFLAIETDEDGGTPKTDYTALRISRDILTRSNWGVLAISKEPQGPDVPVDPNHPGRIVDPDDPSGGIHSNQTYGADVNFSVFRNTKFGGSFLATRTADLRSGQGLGRVYADWSSSNWETEFSYSDVGARFNPEAGFIQRRGIEQVVGYLGRSWRWPDAMLRRVQPHTRLTYTADQEHDLATRRQHWAVSFEFRDGSELEVGWNPAFDELLDTFALRDGVVVPAGSFHPHTWLVLWEGDRSRVLSASVFSEFGEFFDGKYQSVDASVNARLSRHLKVSLGANRNDIHLPARRGDIAVPRPGTPAAGAIPPSEFLATILQARIGVTFTTRMFFDTFLQYNTDLKDFSSNLRFNFKYRPGSDLYVVYNERRDVEGLPADVVDRSLTVKWTYLLAV